ncbi:MAG: PEP/pyruvate-binding domain-containing protein, partial [Candidatus Daviesbacteria bacterium]|nr:PEP/pyruvate-binding domain-containing protein [Candidatus Daviesbacteria bacterium]
MVDKFILHLDEVGIDDIPQVGGKNASLGEMIQKLGPKGVNIPGGYVVTASAYQYFLKETGLDLFIKKELENISEKNLS